MNKFKLYLFKLKHNLEYITAYNYQLVFLGKGTLIFSMFTMFIMSSYYLFRIFEFMKATCFIRTQLLIVTSHLFCIESS